MGCIYSRSDVNQNRRVFRVYNVDDNGLELNAGKIEVGDQDLILYQKGKEPIRWPVRCLRRYGCDAELFSFESGRRCLTGPAIFAFKCQHAEELFNLVQECIQRAGQEERANQSHLGSTNRLHSRPSSIIENPDHNGMMISNRPIHNGLIRNNNGLRLYVNASNAPDNGSHDYINAMPMTNVGATDSTTPLLEIDDNEVPLQESAVNYAVLDLPKSTENLCDDAIDGTRTDFELNLDGNGNYPDSEVFADVDQSGNPNYINVTSDCNVEADQEILTRTLVNVADHNYANISMNSNPALAMSCVSSASPCTSAVSSHHHTPHHHQQQQQQQAPPQHSQSQQQLQVQARTVPQSFHTLPPPPPPPPPPLQVNSEVRKVTYIQLDLNRSSDNLSSGGCVSPTSPLSFSSFPESPGKRTESYAEIDFNKTAALSNSAMITNDNDLGLRKTRHNSTISDFGN